MVISAVSASTRAVRTRERISAACGRAPGSCWRRQPSPTRAHPAGSRSISPLRWPSRQTPFMWPHTMRRMGSMRAISGILPRPGLIMAPLHALQDGVSGGNGVYLYGAGGFPTNTWQCKQLLGGRGLYHEHRSRYDPADSDRVYHTVDRLDPDRWDYQL